MSIVTWSGHTHNRVLTRQSPQATTLHSLFRQRHYHSAVGHEKWLISFVKRFAVLRWFCAKCLVLEANLRQKDRCVNNAKKEHKHKLANEC